MTFRRSHCLPTLVLALSVAAPALADEAQDAFDSLYGQEYRQVVGTSSTADDAALAAKLLDAAKMAEQAPKLQILLLDRAYELGSVNPDGWATAAEAAQLLMHVDADRAVEHQDQLIAVVQKQYLRARGDERTTLGNQLLDIMVAAGDERTAAADYDNAIAQYRKALSLAAMVKSESRGAIAAKLDRAMNLQKLMRQIESLRGKLEADAKDQASAKLLVRIYVLELDDPASAKFFATLTGDEATARLTPLAALPIGDLTDAQCLDLGDWYRGWTNQASTATKPAMLGRSRDYYQRYLDLHSAEDLSRTRATLSLKEIETAISKLDGALAVKATAAPRLTANSIFNGRDLKGWKGDAEAFKVDKGELVTVGARRGAWLMSDGEYRDFVLKFEFKLQEGSSATIGLRVHDDSKNIRIPIMDESNAFAKALPAFLKTGAVLGKLDAPANLKPIGEWNTMEIQMRDLAISVKVNGQQVTQQDLSEAKDFVRQLGRDPRFSKFSAKTVKDATAGSVGIEIGRGEMRFRAIELKPM